MMLFPIFELGIWNAWIFMLSFILQMLVMIFADRRIWKKSHVPGQAKRNRYEKHVGGFANFFWLLALLYSIFLPLKINTIWFYMGIIVFIVGLIILIRATYDFITTKPNKIIKKGAYNFSRHPMYLATFIIILSVAIASLSWLFLILNIFIMFFFYQEALIEESYCREIFNAEYMEYMYHVPRWVGIPK